MISLSKHYSFFKRKEKGNHENDRFTILARVTVSGGYLKTALNNMGCKM